MPKSLEYRIARIETKLGMNKPDKKKSPREIAKAISDGDIDPEQLGKLNILSATALVESAERNIDEDTVKTHSNKEKVKQIEFIEVIIEKIRIDLSPENGAEIIVRFEKLLGMLR